MVSLACTSVISWIVIMLISMILGVVSTLLQLVSACVWACPPSVVWRCICKREVLIVIAIGSLVFMAWCHLVIGIAGLAV